MTGVVVSSLNKLTFKRIREIIMPKLILEFDFETEQDQYEDAANGDKWHGCLQEIDNNIRSIIKHREDWARGKDGLAMAQYIRNMIFSQVDARRLDLFR